MSDTPLTVSTVRVNEDWKLRGLCTTENGAEDPDLWFQDARTKATQVAKSVCADCPVLQLCKSWARDNGEEYGVWGGESGYERKKYWEANGGMPTHFQDDLAKVHDELLSLTAKRQQEERDAA